MVSRVLDCLILLFYGVENMISQKDNSKFFCLQSGDYIMEVDSKCSNTDMLHEATFNSIPCTTDETEEKETEAQAVCIPKLSEINISDPMKEPDHVDSEWLMSSSVSIWQSKLDKQVVSQEATHLERFSAFKSFISTDLDGMPFDEWEIFVNNDVPKKFCLKAKDIRTAVVETAKERHNENKNEVNNYKGEAIDEKTQVEDKLSKYPENIRDFAYNILREGDAFEFILDTWNLRHVGDKNIGENCLCAIASTYILNTRGLHVKPSGESGKGKSDAIETVLSLLPNHKYISGSMSSKSLYYNPDLKSGTIIYSDDANFNDDTIATLKQSTSDFQKPVQHRTVVNQVYAEYSIPERCSFWFSTIDGIPDEQLANRFLNADVDGSKEQDQRVYNYIKDKELDFDLSTEDDVLICQCIFDILDTERYVIKIPYINAIEWTNIENRRNFLKFLDILRSVTLFNVMQRQKLYDYYLSEIEDFNRALRIYQGTAKNNATNLTAQEIRVLKHIEEKKVVTTSGLVKFLGTSRERVMQILNGKNGKSGMLAKVAGLDKIDRSETVGGEYGDKVTTRENVYKYIGPQLGLEIYDSVAKMDLEKAEKEKTTFIQDRSKESVTTVTPNNLSVTSKGFTLKTTTVERIANNVTQKTINAIPDSGDNSFSKGTADVEINREKLVIPCSENLGYSVTLDDKSCHLNLISECNSTAYGGVTYSNIGYSQENDRSAYDTIGLLKRALIKYSRTEYNCTVEDVPRFVASFNEKTPEFEERVGYMIVLEEAEKLHKCGLL